MIAVLLIVLIGPFFVDWTEYRKTIEDYAEQALGQPVTVLGDVGVQLLPVPNLKFADVRVGESENPVATLTSITVIAELPPLLRRELVVQELILEQPTLGVGLDEEGQLDWFIGEGSQRDLDFTSIEVDVIRINDGMVRISDARTGLQHILDDVNLEGHAQSIAGPFRAEGTVNYASGKYDIEAATGRWQKDEGVQLITKIASETGSVQINFSGNLSLSEEKPSYEGGFNISSEVLTDNTEATEPEIWNGEGTFSLSPNEFKVAEATIRFGPEDRAVSVQGDMVAEFGQNRNFKVNLAAKQVNLDRLIGQGPEEPVATSVAAAKVLEFAQSIPTVDGKGTVQASFPSVVVNGSIVQGVELRVKSEPLGWSVSQLSAQLPGRTQVNSRGTFSILEKVNYRGSLELVSEQPATLLNWWQGSPSSEYLWLDPVNLTMSMDLGSAGLQFTGIEGRIGAEQFNGSVRIGQNSDSAKQDVSVNLTTDLLTLEQIEGVSGLLRLPNSSSGTSDSGSILNSNVRLKLSAQQVELEEITVSSVDIALNFNEGKLELTNFEINDLAGASVDANGTIANLLVNPIGSVELVVDAFDLERPASALAKFLPENMIVKHFSSQPDLFAPLRLEVRLSVEPFAEASKSRLSIAGSLAEGRVKSLFTLIGNPFDFAENSLAGEFSVESKNVTNLLRQIGITPQDSSRFGNASLTAQLSSEPNQDMNVDLSLISEEMEITANGSVGNLGSSSLAYNLKLDMKSTSLYDLTTLTGKSFPVPHGKRPVDFIARIAGEGTEFTLSGLKGQYAGVNFSGNLNRSVIRGKESIRGELDVAELRFQSLSELTLGQGVWGSAGVGRDSSYGGSFDGDIWPDIGFKPMTLENSKLEFKINTKKFLLSQDFRVDNASFTLTLSPELMTIDDFTSSMSEGKVLGNMVIRQSAGEAGLIGNVEFEDVLLEDFLQMWGQPPIATGNLSLKADFETTGQSVAGLAKGVTGVGSFTLANGEFSNLNTGAFEKVIADADQGMLIELENVNDRFARYLLSNSFKFNEADGHLSISAGQIKLNKVEFVSEDAEIDLAGVFDIDEWQLESDISIKSNYLDDSEGGIPAVELGFNGPVGKLRHTIDTSKLVTYLAIRYYEKVSRERAARDAQARQREEAVQELKELQQVEETEFEAESGQTDSPYFDAGQENLQLDSTSIPNPATISPQLQEPEIEDYQDGEKEGSNGLESIENSRDERQGVTDINDLIEHNDILENSQRQDIEDIYQNADNNNSSESDATSPATDDKDLVDEIRKKIDAAGENSNENENEDSESILYEIESKELAPLNEENESDQ